jgi:hypothetical protein
MKIHLQRLDGCSSLPCCLRIGFISGGRLLMRCSDFPLPRRAWSAVEADPSPAKCCWLRARRDFPAVVGLGVDCSFKALEEAVVSIGLAETDELAARWGGSISDTSCLLVKCGDLSVAGHQKSWSRRLRFRQRSPSARVTETIIKVINK